MMRLLIYIILFYILWKIIKVFMRSLRSSQRNDPNIKNGNDDKFKYKNIEDAKYTEIKDDDKTSPPDSTGARDNKNKH